MDLAPNPGVDGTTGRSRHPTVSGRKEIEALASAAIAALREAGLTDELQMLQTRAFGLGADRLFDSKQVGVDCWHWSFKPIVELLLLHVRAAAADASRPLEDRRREVRWALAVSGF